jgi:endonuclease III
VTEGIKTETKVEVVEVAQDGTHDITSTQIETSETTAVIEETKVKAKPGAADVAPVSLRNISSTPGVTSKIQKKLGKKDTKAGGKKASTVPRQPFDPEKSPLWRGFTKIQPPADFEGTPFKIVTLKYARSGDFSMPIGLLKRLRIHERNFFKDGRFKVKPASPFWDAGSLGIKFGFSPYIQRSTPLPSQCHEVWDLLDPWLRSRDEPIIVEAVGTNSQGPAHGSTGISISNIFKTILAQGTDNRLAIQAERICASKFPFFVNSKMVIGDTPNFHAMHAATQTQVEDSIKRCGLQKAKAKAIKNVMVAAEDMNKLLFTSGKHAALPAGQPANTDHFVPGLLSLDFLHDMTMVEKFNWLVKQNGISHKTAACVLEFNFGYPICAVDVHVNKMTKYLGWVPANFSELNTFRHLEGRIPNELKHKLHQAFWHHSQKCKRCTRASAWEDELKADEAPCPLEFLMTRFKIIKAKPKRLAGGQTSQKVPKSQADIGPELFLPWNRYENADEAAIDGYIATRLSIDDDFAAGSVNINFQMRWQYVGEQESEEI